MRMRPALVAFGLLAVAADGAQQMPWETTPPPVPIPKIPVKVLPRLTPKENAEAVAAEAEKASGWAVSSSQVASERLRAAKAGNRAYQEEVRALAGQIETSKVGDTILKKAEKVRSLRAKTIEAARETGRLIGEIPDAIERGVKRAVDDVVKDTLIKLEEEKAAVMSAAEAKQAAQEGAGLAGPALGPEAAEPFKNARDAQVSTVDSYVDAAVKLTGQVNALKQRAMEIGKQAVQWQQASGNMVEAQKAQMTAHELMDRAEPLSEEATLYYNAAKLVNQEAGALDELGQAVPLEGHLPEPVPVKLPEPPC